MRPHERHRAISPGQLGFVVVSVSSSRYAARKTGRVVSDESGDAAESEVRKLGHRIMKRNLISDEVGMIVETVKEFLEGKEDVLALLGGTGMSTRDVTIEAVRPFFEKEMEGFGEFLRSYSSKEIGAAAMLTRATAGVAKGKLILCIPGSPNAVRVAFRNLGGELPHALFVARN